MARFEKGVSGNPAGRPRKRRPNVSAFDIIFDKRLMVTQNGEKRELTVDEVLEHKIYREALSGKRMAIRQVIKMIERREQALAKVLPPEKSVPIKFTSQNDPRNADEAMRILRIAEIDQDRLERCSDPEPPIKLATWATQAAISRPARKLLDQRNVDHVERCTVDPDKLKWPRGGKR